MSVSATELKMNLGKYLALAATMDVYITHHGKTIAKLTSPIQDRIAIADSIVGIIPADVNPEELLNERLEML